MPNRNLDPQGVSAAKPGPFSELEKLARLFASATLDAADKAEARARAANDKRVTSLRGGASVEEIAEWNELCPYVDVQGARLDEATRLMLQMLLTLPVPIGDEAKRLSPTHSLERTWKPGERVEAVSGGYGGQPKEFRPGTVSHIGRTYGYHEYLVVAFDDGETRSINPDVMRHIR